MKSGSLESPNTVCSAREMVSRALFHSPGRCVEEVLDQNDAALLLDSMSSDPIDGTYSSQYLFQSTIGKFANAVLRSHSILYYDYHRCCKDAFQRY